MLSSLAGDVNCTQPTTTHHHHRPTQRIRNTSGLTKQIRLRVSPNMRMKSDKLKDGFFWSQLGKVQWNKTNNDDDDDVWNVLTWKRYEREIVACTVHCNIH